MAAVIRGNSQTLQRRPYRVTCYLTKGGVRGDKDPELFSTAMTASQFDKWFTREIAVVEAALARHAILNKPNKPRR
jgi:hypothetical protein